MRRFALLRGYMLSGCLLLAAPLWVAEVVLSRGLGELPLAQLPAPGILPPDTRLVLFDSRALGIKLAGDAELTRQLAEEGNIR